MKLLELTEYRSDGNFYPFVVVVGDNAVFSFFEAELKPTGPHIIGKTKPLGKGSFLVGVAPGMNITVKETVQQIKNLLSDKIPVVSGTGL